MESFEGIVWEGLQPDDIIYRTITFCRLTQLLKQQKNTLTRPTRWPDKYEGLLEQARIRSAMPGIGRFKGLDSYYGQCWTLHKASEAIWQIYSKGDDRTDGFRLRTTVRKLLTSLKDQVEECDIRCHIGRVQYMSDNGLIKFGKTHFQKLRQNQEPIVSEQIAKTYMVKRNAFRHEKEVRLIYNLSDKPANPAHYFQYNINPNELFDQIMLNPLLDECSVSEKKNAIKKLGFEGKIKQSRIYEPPRGFDFLFGPQKMDNN